MKRGSASFSKPDASVKAPHALVQVAASRHDTIAGKLNLCLSFSAVAKAAV
jgi:hypothetical protein